MTVQELQEVMTQRFDRVEGDVKELRTDMKELRTDMTGLREKVDSDIKELREKVDSDIKGLHERLDSYMKELREKVDKLLELQHYQRGQREFSSRFFKHAAWVGPTIIALVALIKSFF